MSARDRTVVAVVCALVAIVGGWLLVIQPKRDQASKLGSQVSAAESQLASERTLVAQDKAAQSAFAGSYTQLARLGEAVPPDDNVPSLIYQLQGAASAAGVGFVSLVLQPGTGPTAPAQTPTTSSSSGGKASTPGSAAAAAALTAPLPPGATVGPAGFPEEQFAFSFNGNFFHLANFFKRLEDFVVATNKRVSVSGRLMTLNAFSLAPGTAGFPSITASVSATTYLVPASEGLFAGASPLGPASGSTPTTTPTSGSSSSSSTPPAATITP